MLDSFPFLPAEWQLHYSCNLGTCYMQNSLYRWEWFSFPQQFWGWTGQLGDTRQCTCPPEVPFPSVSLFAAFGYSSLLVSQTLPPIQFHFWGAEVKQEQMLELLSEGGCLYLAAFAQGFPPLVSSKHIVHIPERDPTWGCPKFCTAQNWTSRGSMLSTQRQAVPGQHGNEKLIDQLQTFLFTLLTLKDWGNLCQYFCQGCFLEDMTVTGLSSSGDSWIY